MTDRICALTVLLDEDIREDDVQSLCEAIQHMRHVAKVECVVTNHSEALAERARITNMLNEKFTEIVRGLWGSR